MSDNYLSGKDASVLVGTAEYSFSKWKISMKTSLPKVTNFTTGGFQALIDAITGATITLEGPYNEGNMPLTCGSSYSFTLGFTSMVNLVVTARVETIEATADVEDAQRVTVTAQSTGTFTASLT